MKLFGGVELFGPITIVANFVFTSDLIGWGFVMEDCIGFYIYGRRKLFTYSGEGGVGDKDKIETT